MCSFWSLYYTHMKVHLIISLPFYFSVTSEIGTLTSVVPLTHWDVRFQKYHLNLWKFRQRNINISEHANTGTVPNPTGWRHVRKQAVQSDDALTALLGPGDAPDSHPGLALGWTGPGRTAGSGLRHSLNLQGGSLHQCWSTAKRRRKRRRLQDIPMFAVTLQASLNRF